MRITKKKCKTSNWQQLVVRFVKMVMPVFFFAIPLSSSAQKNTVQGTVVDSNNDAIIGASVLIKGTSTGTITNYDGNFKLEASAKDVIIISYVGMIPQEIVVGSQKSLQVILKETAKSLDEVIVVGYGTAKRKDLTTSVSSVSTKDISERPIISAAGAIQGKAAGVSVVQPNGEPGGGFVVRVRGNTSIAASNDPLYVIDGVPMSEVNFLSPNDIESMQILKDASATAIYGSRAANGVVLITTKQGVKGEAKVTFSTKVGMTQVVKQLESLNVAQYKELMDELGAVTLPDGLTDKTDWFKETFRTGLSQDYQLSVSNSTEKLNYYFSGGYTNEKGVIPVAYYKRYNFRVNLDNQIKPWLKFTTNMAYSDYTNNGIISGQGANRAGVILSVINTPTYASIWDEANPGQYYNNFYGTNVTHPVENMSRTEDNKNNSNRLVASGISELSFTKDLKLKSSLSVDRVYYHSTSFLDPIKTSYGRSMYGQASDNRSLSSIMVLDNILSYDNVFGKNTLGAMAGTSYTTSTWNQSYMTGSHFADSDIKTLNAANKIEQWSGTSASEWAIMSYLGRLTYNYDSKYLLTVNFRADGSSKLAPGHKWGYFPSASAAWRISSEEFMQGIDWIDDLKLRGGWGKTGNQSGLGDYGYLAHYNIVRARWWEPIGGVLVNADAVPTTTQSSMSNVDLTWETTTQSNIGIDFTLFKNKLAIAIDAYYKYTTDLLLGIDLPTTNLITNLTRNEGDMSNKGIELTVNSKNITRRNFSWDTDFNISLNRNKIEKFRLTQNYDLAEMPTGEKVVKMKPGLPLGVFYGYVALGVDPETGNLLYETVKEDGVPLLSERKIIGDPNPDFIYGMTNNLRYKNFNLNIFLQGSQGNDIYNASRMETEGMYDDKNQSTAVLDRWKRPGMVTYMPKASATKENLLPSTRFVEDGSYLRIKALTLSYSFEKNWLKAIKLSKIQAYFTAQNLLTLTNYKGFDPEVNQYGGYAPVQGVDYGTYPQSKNYVFGINVEF